MIVLMLFSFRVDEYMETTTTNLSTHDLKDARSTIRVLCEESNADTTSSVPLQRSGRDYHLSTYNSKSFILYETPIGISSRFDTSISPRHRPQYPIVLHPCHHYPSANRSRLSNRAIGAPHRPPHLPHISPRSIPHKCTFLLPKPQSQLLSNTTIPHPAPLHPLASQNRRSLGLRPFLSRLPHLPRIWLPHPEHAVSSRGL